MAFQRLASATHQQHAALIDHHAPTPTKGASGYSRCICPPSASLLIYNRGSCTVLCKRLFFRSSLTRRVELGASDEPVRGLPKLLRAPSLRFLFVARAGNLNPRPALFMMRLPAHGSGSCTLSNRVIIEHGWKTRCLNSRLGSTTCTAAPAFAASARHWPPLAGCRLKRFAWALPASATPRTLRRLNWPWPPWPSRLPRAIGRIGERYGIPHAPSSRHDVRILPAPCGRSSRLSAWGSVRPRRLDVQSCHFGLRPNFHNLCNW